MEVHVIEVDWSRYQERLRRIRQIVFVQEQQVPQALEWDGLDDDAIHFMAIDSAGRDVGCARLLPTGQIGRMAVQQNQRGQGIGSQLLEAAVAKAQALGMNDVFLHAQTHAVGFYRKGGFVESGDEFQEAGIPHRNMTRLLAIAAPGLHITPRATYPDAVATQVSRQERHITLFDNEQDACRALLTGIGTARRELVLVSSLLEGPWFDQGTLVEAVSDLARRAAATRVRILIQSSDLLVSRGHRVVELSRRLSSKITVRLLAPDAEVPRGAFAAWDESGCWLLPDESEPAGALHVDDPVTARRLFQTFERLWAGSREDPELRILRL